MLRSLGQDFTPYKLIKFTLPSIVMMVFMSLYTIIDGIFVARFLGSNALSAVNIIYPVINLLIAIGIMLGTGGCSIISKKMGEGNFHGACQDFSLLTLIGVVCSLVLCLLGHLFILPIVTLLGATPLLFDDCVCYLKLLLKFAPVCILQLLFQSFFVAAGKPFIGLVLTLLGGIANGILDYVLLVPFSMGMEGAALATGIGQAIPAVFGLIYFTFVKNHLYFVIPKMDFFTLKHACLNGSSEMVTNCSTAVVTILFNIIMIRLLGEDGVAAITIALYGQFLFHAIFLGFSIGVAPIFSYNYGAKNILQLQNVFRMCLYFVVGCCLLSTVIALLSTSFIVGIFVPTSTKTYEIATYGLFLFSFNYLFAGLNIFISSLFTALSNGKISAILSFMRTFVFIILSLLLLPYLLGVTGVWLAIPVAEFLTVFLSIFYLKKQNRVYHYKN